MIDLARIAVDAPPEEQENARSMIRQLRDLESYVDDFRAALDLSNFSMARMHSVHQAYQASRARGKAQNDGWPTRRSEEEQKLLDTERHLSTWQNIAGRDAAMTLFHFFQAMKCIRILLHACPWISAAVSKVELKAVTKAFVKVFPAYENARDAVGHRAETVGSPENERETGTDQSLRLPFLHSDGKGTIIRAGIVGQTYYATHKRKLVQFDLSAENLATLEALCIQFQEPFSKAEAILQTRRREKILEQSRGAI